MSQTINNATIRLYGCGGCGINIAKRYLNKGNNGVGYAQIQPAFLDSSYSNLQDIRTLTDDVYILTAVKKDPNKEGSGKVRAEFSDEIKAEVKNVILDIPPGDFNIVVSSGSGGTGAMFAAAVMAELLERKVPVLAIVLGSGEDLKAVENTVKSLRTLEGISRAKKAAVNFAYFFNERNGTRKAADNAIYDFIGAISILTSKQNEELDTQDIYNWLNYNDAVSSVAPTLGLVELWTTAADVEAIPNPLSMASLYSEHDVAGPDVMAAYSCTGYAPINFGNTVDRLHFVISTEPVTEIYEDLDSNLKQITERTRSSSSAHRGILTDTAMADADGFEV